LNKDEGPDTNTLFGAQVLLKYKRMIACTMSVTSDHVKRTLPSKFKDSSTTCRCFSALWKQHFFFMQ